MINKQNLWFLTLFSLVLILGVYYVTMPNEILASKSKNSEVKKDKTKVVVKELSTIDVMREDKEAERGELIATLKERMTNDKSTTEEKNNAYEELKSLNQLQGKEEKLEKKIKEKHNLDCFVKIDQKSNCEVVCVSSKHDNVIANNIMRTIQEEFTDKLSITVKFQKK